MVIYEVYAQTLCFGYVDAMDGRYIPYTWPLDNVSSDGDVGHTGFNYSSHGIDNSRASAAYRNDPTISWLRMLSEVWLTIPMACFGIIGNFVSLVVLCYHRRLKKLQTIVIQLQALAVVDTLILLTMLLLRFFTHIFFCSYIIRRSPQKAALPITLRLSVCLSVRPSVPVPCLHVTQQLKVTGSLRSAKFEQLAVSFPGQEVGEILQTL